MTTEDQGRRVGRGEGRRPWTHIWGETLCEEYRGTGGCVVLGHRRRIRRCGDGGTGPGGVVRRRAQGWEGWVTEDVAPEVRDGSGA